MNKSIISGVKLIISAAILISLYGCMAAMLVPLAPLIGGLAPNSNKVVVNEATVAPELRQAFSTAKTLTLIGGDQSDVYMAEYLDQQGAFDVRIEGNQKQQTPSQRRDEMRRVCDKNIVPDLVLSTSLGNSDASTGTTLKGVVTGRINFNVTGTVEVLRCKDRWSSKFEITAEIAQGIYNADQTKLNQELGRESAKALMQLAGKTAGNSNGKQASGEAQGSHEAQAAPTPVAQVLVPSQPQTPQQPPTMSIADAQVKLNSLGFAVGAPDGILGPKSHAQLRNFQKSRGIQTTGELDSATIVQLSK